MCRRRATHPKRSRFANQNPTPKAKVIWRSNHLHRRNDFQPEHHLGNEPRFWRSVQFALLCGSCCQKRDPPLSRQPTEHTPTAWRILSCNAPYLLFFMLSIEPYNATKLADCGFNATHYNFTQLRKRTKLQ